MVIRALGRDDVGVYRRLRLDALANDPEAFGSTYEHELAHDDDTWLQRLTSFAGRPGQVFVAEQTGVPVGMVGIGSGSESESAILWGMWVRPEARGSGMGRRLVEAAVEWARDTGASDIILQVARHNDGAYRLYEGCGFELIGQAPMRPDDPCSLAHMMRLEL